MQQTIWTCDINSGISVDVTSEIAAATKSSTGDLRNDMERLAGARSIVLCNAIRITSTENSYVVECKHVQIDLQSWSMLLLAIGSQKRSVEFNAFNCGLSEQHL
mgnify:CR=1 FL=1